MRTSITVLSIVAVLQLNAQKNIDGLIAAEKSFAAYSVAHGTKDAFLKFLDSNGIVFEQGKAINGIRTWEKRENRLTVLSWRPQYVEIASSNDFGYTTGPWELCTSASSDSVVARGRFSTVWHIDARGEWKCLVDLGVGNSPNDTELKVEKIKGRKVTGEPSKDEVLKVEQSFIESCQKNKVKGYNNFLSRKTILLRNGRLPAQSVDDVALVIKQTPGVIGYTVTGSGIAQSGDLAFVYGNTSINNKEENYLRVWRKEKDGWKIAMEVLRY
ncbi:MAG: hypothetical protein ACXVBZ_14180 [Flavisolibacter sp.]